MSNKWDHHFLRLALAHARMSKDPSTQTGTVIVAADRCVLSIGFNGFPRGVLDLPERLADRATKLKIVVHSEMNAVLAAARHGIPLDGAVLYHIATDSTGVWGGPPCTRCLVECMQAGIAQFVSLPFKSVPSRWSEDLALSQVLLQESGLSYREVEGFAP